MLGRWRELRYVKTLTSVLVFFHSDLNYPVKKMENKVVNLLSLPAIEYTANIRFLLFSNI